MSPNAVSPNAVSVAEVPARDGLDWTPTQLERATAGFREPFVLRGHYGAPAVGTWTVERLVEAGADRSYAIEYYDDGDHRKPFAHREMTMRAYADALARGEGDRYYLAADDPYDLFPGLTAELPQPTSVPDGLRRVTRSIFVGDGGGSGLHFHTKDRALLVQLVGTKRIVLSGPETSRLLADHSAFGGRPQWSRRGPEVDGDAEAYFADLLGPAAVLAEIEPGDALFIPVHWWHWAECRGPSSSFTTFWRANAREWAFPRPGFRAATAVGLNVGVRAARWGRSKLVRAA